ncbi:MAG: adenylyltransferase/cytidyltransferase family protein [Planctomycetes bacterium]|nr:adenylyltransferase/cytidyltransferase family protein [Planctomycetota bacterium]
MKSPPRKTDNQTRIDGAVVEGKRNAMSQEGYLGKIIGLDAMALLREQARAAGKRCVLAHGIFDVIHPGHTRHLEWARGQGDVLLVTVVEDNRGPRIRTPVEIRMENLSALSMVDHVAKVPCRDATYSIERLKPDVLVRGMEFHGLHAGIAAKERQILESYGGELLFSSGDPGYSNIRTAELEGSYLKQRWTSLHQLLDRQKITPERLEELLGRFQGIRAAVIGDTIIEEYIHCNALGMSSEDPVVVVKPKRSERFLGGAAGIAEHAAALGAQACLLTVAGEDPTASFLKKRAEASRVHYRLFSDGTRPTTLKQRFLAGRKKLLRANYLEEHPIPDRLVEQIVKEFDAASRDVDLIIFWDGSYGAVPATLRERIISQAQDLGKRVVAMAPCSTQIANVDRYRNIDFIVTTEREVRMSCWDTVNSLVQVGFSLLQKTGNQGLIISLGENGTLIFTREGDPEYLPPLATEVQDPLGTTDTMMVAAALGRAAGATLFEAAILGCAAQAVEAAHAGIQPISQERIRSLLFERIYPEEVVLT